MNLYSMTLCSFRQPYLLAGLSLGIINTYPIYQTKLLSDSHSIDMIIVAVFELLFALILATLLQGIEYLAQRMYDRSNHRFYFMRFPQYLPWIILAVLHSQYVAADLGGATHKLSRWMSLEHHITFIHGLMTLPICCANLGIVYSSQFVLNGHSFFSSMRSQHRRILHQLWFGLVALCTAYLNESILEGDYYGVHFWLSTLTMNCLLLVFQVRLNQPITSKKISSFFPHLIVMSSLILIGSRAGISQSVREDMSRRESSFGLKLWGRFKSQRAEIDQISTIPQTQWLEPKLLRDKVQQEQNFIPQQKTNIKPVVILLTIDSLKADWFIHPQKKLDELKTLQTLTQTSNTWFSSKIFSPSTSTRFTLGSIIFGRYPSHLNWVKDRATHPSLHDENQATLWEQLRQGQVSSTYIATVKDIIRIDNGLARGFDKVINLPPRKGFKVAFSPSVIDQLLQELEPRLSDPKGHIIFSHLLDAHHPFNGGLRRGKNKIQNHLSELKVIDQQIHRLIKWIGQSHARSRIWLIISSDHGQGFGRHHIKTHNGPAYEHQARVPLWIYHPRNSIPSAMDQSIYRLWAESFTWSTLDLHPTLLDLFGLPNAQHTQGISWWPFWQVLAADSSTDSIIYEYAKRLITILEDRPLLSINWYTRALFKPKSHFKLIEDTRTQTIHLFNLRKDPQEKQNLCMTQSKVCTQMRESLFGLVYGHGRQPIEMTKRR